MRKLTFKTQIDSETFEPKNFLYLDDLKTNICFNKHSVYEAVAFHGTIIFEDLSNILMEELKIYNLTGDEEKSYRVIFDEMIEELKINEK